MVSVGLSLGFRFILGSHITHPVKITHAEMPLACACLIASPMPHTPGPSHA